MNKTENFYFTSISYQGETYESRSYIVEIPEIAAERAAVEFTEYYFTQFQEGEFSVTVHDENTYKFKVLRTNSMSPEEYEHSINSGELVCRYKYTVTRVQDEVTENSVTKTTGWIEWFKSFF